MARKQYRHMRVDDTTALVKLVRHSGIRLLDAITLEKGNFDLTQKTILFKQRKQTRLRITTIRPNEVEWFRQWLKALEDRLFPFSTRTVYYHIHKITNNPHSIRKELWDEMRLLGAKDNIVAVKMGYYVDVDPDVKTDLFIKLQEFEEKHFGDKN